MSTLTARLLFRTLHQQQQQSSNNNNNKRQRCGSQSDGPSSQLLADLTKDLFLTTECRRFQTFSTRLQTLLQYLETTIGSKQQIAGVEQDQETMVVGSTKHCADVHIDWDPAWLRQLHTLLILSLSHHIRRQWGPLSFLASSSTFSSANNNSTNHLLLLSCLDTMVSCLFLLYHHHNNCSQSIPLVILLSVQETEEALALLLKSVICWLANAPLLVQQQQPEISSPAVSSSVLFRSMQLVEQLWGSVTTHATTTRFRLKLSPSFLHYSQHVLQRTLVALRSNNSATTTTTGDDHEKITGHDQQRCRLVQQLLSRLQRQLFDPFRTSADTYPAMQSSSSSYLNMAMHELQLVDEKQQEHQAVSPCLATNECGDDEEEEGPKHQSAILLLNGLERRSISMPASTSVMKEEATLPLSFSADLESFPVVPSSDILYLNAATMNTNQLQLLQNTISQLVQRVLYPEYEHDDHDERSLRDWETSRREAFRVLIPILRAQLSFSNEPPAAATTKPVQLQMDNDMTAPTIPLQLLPKRDVVAITQSLLLHCSDQEVVHEGARMLCRLDATSQTAIFHQHPSLLSALAVVLQHPFAPAAVQLEILETFFQLTRQPPPPPQQQQCNDVFLANMARQPTVLQAVSQMLSSRNYNHHGSSNNNDNNNMNHRNNEQGRMQAMSILMVLSRPVGNHRVVARQIGVLASMIRFVRDYQDDGDFDNARHRPRETGRNRTRASTLLGWDREALKARILQVAEAL